MMKGGRGVREERVEGDWKMGEIEMEWRSI